MELNGFKVECFDLLDSTNNYLKLRAREGAPDRLAATAYEQSGGKGRLGRSFFSPKRGLYLSALVRGVPVGVCHLLTPMAAVATLRACEDCGAEGLGIKWVNDLYRGGRKVCGILTETQISTDGSALDWAVIGIGVNIIEPLGGYPGELGAKAGAAFERAGEDVRDLLLAATLRRLSEGLEGLEHREFLNEYRRRSTLIGREVGARGERVRAEYIDDDCGLVVRREDGSLMTLRAGEVSLEI